MAFGNNMRTDQSKMPNSTFLGCAVEYRHGMLRAFQNFRRTQSRYANRDGDVNMEHGQNSPSIWPVASPTTTLERVQIIPTLRSTRLEGHVALVFARAAAIRIGSTCIRRDDQDTIDHITNGKCTFKTFRNGFLESQPLAGKVSIKYVKCTGNKFCQGEIYRHSIAI